MNGFERKMGGLRMMAASDLHYLSPQLMEYRGTFREMCEAIGEPEMERIEAVADELLETVRREKPDVFLITGDLSYQGEKLSHVQLAGKLAGLVRAGIHVYVVPGNQDMENPFSMCWRPGTEGDGRVPFPVESVSAGEFKKIYHDMGYNENDKNIVSRAPDSLSYQVHLTKPDADIFMLDTTISMSPKGEIPPGTLVWLEERLGKRNEKGLGKRQVPCIIAGHHPMLPLNESGYTLENSEELCRLMWKYQVPFYISGHLHQSGTAAAPEPGNRLKQLRRLVRRLTGTGRNCITPINIFLEKRKCVAVQSQISMIGKE